MFSRSIKKSFGFLKTFTQRGNREVNDNFLYHISKERKILFNEQNAKTIDLSKLNVQYLGDTDDLITNVPQLQHGLSKHLNGELVFGDQGAGDLPKRSQQTSNQQIQKISGYVQPSKDNALMDIATKQKIKYVSSTSSISSPLIALYYIFSSFRTPLTDNIYENLNSKPSSWMISYRKPTIFYLRKINQNIQAVVADHGVMPASNQVLMSLGHIIEYFLTHTRQETDKLMRGEAVQQANNYYRYAKVNNQFMLRSQIDCKSFDQNGKPYVFQIKSRACAPIRYDIQNYKLYTDYQIDVKKGLYESFEREYFDLIRGGFLKYVLQVKIGRMDGAFVAYHNTQKIYGYEYVKIKEMALRVFGDEYNLDVSFVCINKMLSIVLDHIRKSLPQYKDDDLKIGFYSEYRSRRLIVMVECMSKVKEYKPLQQHRQGIKNSTDYFLKIAPIQNPVFKFEFDFCMFVNGVRLNNPQILLTPYDTLQMKYNVTEKRQVSLNQYLLFLHQSYKDEDFFNSILYKGLWGYSESQSD